VNITNKNNDNIDIKFNKIITLDDQWRGRNLFDNLKVKIILFNVIVFIFFMGVASYIVYKEISDSFKNSLHEQLEESSRRLAANLSEPLWALNRRLASDIINSEMVNNNIARVIVKENLLEENFCSWVRDASWRPKAGDDPFVESPVNKVVPISYKGDKIGELELTVTGRYLGDYVKNKIWQPVLVIFFGGTLALFVYFIWIKKIVLNRVLKLSTLVKSVFEDDDYSYRIEDKSHDELGKLANRVNCMLQQILENNKNLKEYAATLEDTVAARTAEIEARIQAEQALRHSEEKFSSLFKFLPDPIMVVHEEKLILFDANDAFLKLFGYSKEEVLGRTTLDLGVYVDLSQRNKIIEAIKSDNHLENFEVEFNIRDGSLRICSVSAQSVMIYNEKYTIVVMRDVTESKKMQAIMIQTEKMMSIGGIAAGMAHEINNPLGIILQASQNIQQRFETSFQKNITAANALGIDIESLRKYLDDRKIDVFINDIQSAAKRASNIIHNMLDFSRSSDPHRKLNNVISIIQNSIRLASNDYDLVKNYDFKRVTITLNCTDNIQDIYCVETEIEQVVLNVLRNAAQAMTLNEVLDDPRINISVGATAHYVTIEIADNGPGISQDVQKRMFEPFFTTKPTGVGTGLGLSVSYFIITKGHGGQMSVVSTPGKGATFIINLPRNITETTMLCH